MRPPTLFVLATSSTILLACGAAPDEPPVAPVAPPPQPAPVVAADTPTTTAATAPASTTEKGPLPPLPSQAPRYAPADDTPSETQWTQGYATGRWVYTSNQGWVWVPAGSASTEVDGVPYAYLYTPAWGWTWYLSPWGWGPYRYGAWVRHPWHPAGWHGPWRAPPHVVVHLGRGGHHR